MYEVIHTSAANRDIAIDGRTDLRVQFVDRSDGA